MYIYVAVLVTFLSNAIFISLFHGFILKIFLWTYFPNNFQGSHGFMMTHKWRDSIGAFINVEASGSGGPGMASLKVEYCYCIYHEV